MPIKVTMPRLSDTMEQGTVVKWNVRPGDKVQAGQVIADIETDKATMELQSFDAGTVASIDSPEGKAVPVGTVIMVIAKEGESASPKSDDPPPGDAESKRSPVPPAPERDAPAPGRSGDAPGRGGRAADPLPVHGSNGAGSPDAERVFASPLARKIAAESGLDLSTLSGSGPGGRIVRKDVEAAAAGPRSAGSPARSRAAAPPAPMPPAGATLQARTVALSNMRQTIARRLVESKATIPHYQVTVEVEMDALQALRAQLNEQLAGLSGGGGVKLSVNDFLVRACALAMHEHPMINSRWVERGKDGPAIEVVGHVNIGIAIAMPEERGGGLVVGTVRAADSIGLRQISSESRRLASKAREKGLDRGDVRLHVHHLQPRDVLGSATSRPSSTPRTSRFWPLAPRWSARSSAKARSSSGRS